MVYWDLSTTLLCLKVFPFTSSSKTLCPPKYGWLSPSSKPQYLIFLFPSLRLDLNSDSRRRICPVNSRDPESTRWKSYLYGEGKTSVTQEGVNLSHPEVANEVCLEEGSDSVTHVLRRIQVGQWVVRRYPLRNSSKSTWPKTLSLQSEVEEVRKSRRKVPCGDLRCRTFRVTGKRPLRRIKYTFKMSDHPSKQLTDRDEVWHSKYSRSRHRETRRRRISPNRVSNHMSSVNYLYVTNLFTYSLTTPVSVLTMGKVGVPPLVSVLWVFFWVLMLFLILHETNFVGTPESSPGNPLHRLSPINPFGFSTRKTRTYLTNKLSSFLFFVVLNLDKLMGHMNFTVNFILDRTVEVYCLYPLRPLPRGSTGRKNASNRPCLVCSLQYNNGFSRTSPTLDLFPSTREGRFRIYIDPFCLSQYWDPRKQKPSVHL